MPVGETVGGPAERDVRSEGGPARTGVDREANPHPSKKWGAVLMLVLLVVALVWVAVRVVAMLRLLVADDDEPVLSAVALQDRPTPQDAVVARSPRRPEGTFRETVIDVLRRPDRGPTCFGGRDDAAYLSGWDDAVDWIGRGQDAKAPTWGDLAYMTGWYDGVRDVAAQRAR